MKLVSKKNLETGVDEHIIYNDGFKSFAEIIHTSTRTK